MTVLALNPQLETQLEIVVGRSLNEKMVSLLETYLTAQIRTCENEIATYEIKYHTTFDEFSAAWERDEVPHKHSHEVERDYMEWEGLVAEKQQWLRRLHALTHTERNLGERA